MKGNRGFILVLNERRVQWEVWYNLGDRGEWLQATIKGTKALAEKIRLIIEEDYYKEIENAIRPME